MAADQPNSQYWTYVDDGGNTWNKRGPVNSAINAVDGSAAFTSGAAVFPRGTKRFHCRQAVFIDATTFRTVRFPVFTAAAYAAIIATPPTLALHVPGETATVNYTLSDTIPERLPKAKASRALADHA
jgi:hypothetical protein